MFRIFWRLVFILMAFFFIYRGYSVIFSDGYIVGDELLNGNEEVLERRHLHRGIAFFIIGLYILYYWTKTLFERRKNR